MMEGIRRRERSVRWLRGVCVLAVLCAAAGAALGQETSWIADNGYWNQGANWDAGVPDANTTAYILNGGQCWVSLPGAEANYLYVGGSLDANLTSTVHVMAEANLAIGNDWIVGNPVGGRGVVCQQGNVTVGNSLYLSHSGTSAGGAGDANFYLSSGTLNVVWDEYLGVNGTGRFIQSGGSNLCWHEIWVGTAWGQSGTGTYVLREDDPNIPSFLGCGTDSNLPGGLYVGCDQLVVCPYEGGTGSFLQLGGRCLLDVLVVGHWSDGNYLLSGGDLRVVGAETIAMAGTYGRSGWPWTPSSATFVQNDGNHTVDGVIYVGSYWAGGSAQFCMNGGRLTAGFFEVGTGLGEAYMILGGGTTTFSGRGLVREDGILELAGGSFGAVDPNLRVDVDNYGLLHVTEGNYALGQIIRGDYYGGGVTQIDANCALSVLRIRQHDANVGAWALLAIDSPVKTVSIVDRLTIDGNLDAWRGTLDIGRSCLVIRDGNYATVYNQVKSGFNDFAWNGTGIESNTAACDQDEYTAVGVAQASYLNLGGGSWEGVALDGNEILVKFTYYGDADLNGVVDGDDYNIWEENFGGPGDWQNGDWDYDGQVTGDDYNMWEAGYLAMIQQGGSLPPLASGAIPEPGTLVVVGFGAVCCLSRRRRRAAGRSGGV